MKTLVFHSAFLALIGLILSPLAVAYASPSPSDSVHFCQLIDYEQWQRDHPPPPRSQAAGAERGRTTHRADDLFPAE